MTPRDAPFEIAMADALVPMWRKAFEHGVDIVDPHPIEQQHAYLVKRMLPAHDVTVALDGERIVGLAASNAESVNQLFIRVGHLGRGIGATLLRRAMAASAGSLRPFTFACNARARRLYQRNGFTTVAFGFEPTWRLDDVRFELRCGPSEDA